MDGGGASASEVVSVKQGKEEESNLKRPCSTILPGTTNECKKMKSSSVDSNPEETYLPSGDAPCSLKVEPEVDWICGSCGGRNDFSKKSCTCWETFVSDGTIFGKKQPKLHWICGTCPMTNLPEKCWVWCETCGRWCHRNCVNNSAPYVPGVEYICTACTIAENTRIAMENGVKFEPPKDEPEVDWICGSCGGRNDFSKKSCTCWEAYIPDAIFPIFAKQKPELDWICHACGITNFPEKYWVWCETCTGWIHHGNCVNNSTPYVPGVEYKCTSCTADENFYLRHGMVPKGYRKFGEDVDLICGACGINDFSEKSWIWCKTCKEWFHYECVGVTIAPMPGRDYKCPVCVDEEAL